MINTKNDGLLGYGVTLQEILETYSRDRLKSVREVYGLAELRKQDGKYIFDSWICEICRCFRDTLEMIDYEGYCTLAAIESDDSSIESFSGRCVMAFESSGCVFPLLTPEGEIRMLPKELMDIFKEEDCEALKKNSLYNDEMYKLINGAMYLYGLMDYPRFFSLIKENTECKFDDREFRKLLKNCEAYHGLIAHDVEIVYSRCYENLEYFKKEQRKFQKYGYREFSREELMSADWLNVKNTPENMNMMLLLNRVFDADMELCRASVGVFITNAKCCRKPEHSLAYVSIELGEVTDEFVEEFLPLHCEINNSTPNFALLGHTPNEIMLMQSPELYEVTKAYNLSAHIFGNGQPYRKTNNTGRNDLCPCGSGRKYKYCCLSKDEKGYMN
jgi:hypothetical protein